jgi:hypothetical protein
MMVEYELDGNGVVKSVVSPITGGLSFDVRVVPENWISSGQARWPRDRDIDLPWVLLP